MQSCFRLVTWVHRNRLIRVDIAAWRCKSTVYTDTKPRIDPQGPTFQDFLNKTATNENIAENQTRNPNPNGSELSYFIETYGCQMNVSDSEIVRSVLQKQGHYPANTAETADLVLLNTCAIRENAEAKIWNRLAYLQSVRRDNKSKPINIDFFPKKGKKTTATSAIATTSTSSLLNENKKKTTKNRKHLPYVGVLGCMAERLKESLLDEDSVDFVVGPDAYRDIPRLIHQINNTGQKEANTQLSLEETYADISPIRESENCSAFVSIMRGCNNMCSYCIVPFTRGRERSRHMSTILNEINILVHGTADGAGSGAGSGSGGVKEVCLLGQNVNTFHDTSPESAEKYGYGYGHDSIDTESEHEQEPEDGDDYSRLKTPESYETVPEKQTTDHTTHTTEGFNNMFKSKSRLKPGARFYNLLKDVSDISPELRIRFTSPHPKDFPINVLNLIAKKPNLCKSLHMPAQSGSTEVLKRMRRGYSRESYIDLVLRARDIIPNVTISTDIITGFCGETEEEHQDTLSLMDIISYEQAFLFAYSNRNKTHASRQLEDNIPIEIKNRRLQEIINVYRLKLLEKNRLIDTNSIHLVLIEGYATRSTIENPMLTGRTDGNKRVIFSSKNPVFTSLTHPHIIKNNYLNNAINILEDSVPILTKEINQEIANEETLLEMKLIKEQQDEQDKQDDHNNKNKKKKGKRRGVNVNTRDTTPEVVRKNGRLSSAFTNMYSNYMNTLPVEHEHEHDNDYGNNKNDVYMIQSYKTHVHDKQNRVLQLQPGDYVVVFVSEAEGPTLRGTAIAKSTMSEFYQHPLSQYKNHNQYQ
jgi:tRNA A37 methylthiotransferase MiaB